MAGLLTEGVAAKALTTSWDALTRYLTDNDLSQFANNIASLIVPGGTLRNVMYPLSPEPPLEAGQLPDNAYVIWAQEYVTQFGAVTRIYQLRSCRFAAHLDYQTLVTAPATLRIIQ